MLPYIVKTIVVKLKEKLDRFLNSYSCLTVGCNKRVFYYKKTSMNHGGLMISYHCKNHKILGCKEL